MPTVLENLEAAKVSLSAEIASVSANPKPDYSIDGQSVSWGTYLDTLLERMKLLDERILFENRNASDTKPTSVDYDTSWRDGYARSPLFDQDGDVQ